MQLQLEPSEIEFIMNSLAQQPYIQVAELIDKIKQQATAQLRSTQPMSSQGEPVANGQPVS